MTVTDPDVPDPLNDPRTLQADPGAYGQGEDLASGEDDAAVSGEEEMAEEEREQGEELAAGRTAADDAGGGDVTGGMAPGVGTASD
ncbi:hypothetical protein [Geodermatophilus sabuli]|uniref:Uncharacterized protein n=1 Tax=Geodermatophilus sabuli TaxID=1564158 RepID=A0A285E8A0_9ACTN|nr:hypothetical protein [Geodermatophilus sabuli]MBB3085245.1 hypothetical protein [Geodermatophilus sabuli]SNX95348.1 hypothetical protein SAMN06893097_10242 [Geodermatophilus sabuli]